MNMEWSYRPAGIGRAPKRTPSRVPTAIEKSALAARRDGLLEIVAGRMRPTAQGRRFLNRLLGGFLG